MTDALSRKTALEVGREHWIWRRDNPEVDPIYWPGWAEISHTPTWGGTDACTCCLYATQKVGKSSGSVRNEICRRYCPLRNFWPKADYGCPCCVPDSPYDTWRDEESTPQKVHDAAEQIIRYHTMALTNLAKERRHGGRMKNEGRLIHDGRTKTNTAV